MLRENKYIGGELELFREAAQWKGYFSKVLRPYVQGRVLEVGAGIGGTTAALYNDSVTSWTCLEPDRELAEELRQVIAADSRLASCQIQTAFVSDLPPDEQYDTILYIDVLEHIEQDQQEMEQAFQRLAPNGSLIVLSPAHQWLYSKFDNAIGHFRRYSRVTLQTVAPKGAGVRLLRYLDSVGMLASAANRVLLSQSMPERRQILFWDRCMVPVSRVFDRLLGYRLGKSVVAVWSKPTP